MSTPQHHDLAAISAINHRRALRWHPQGLKQWSASDWACAMAGEAGEICNAVKKLNRIEGGIQQAKGPQTYEEAIADVAKEIGDTFLYLDLLARRLGINFPRAIADTFNRVSEREGFPDRISQEIIGEPQTGVDLIAAERRRQIEEEGFAPERDLTANDPGDLATAGACYALHAAGACYALHVSGICSVTFRAPLAWPWRAQLWKPKDPVRDLVRAGALIAAELDRLRATRPELFEDKSEP